MTDLLPRAYTEKAAAEVLTAAGWTICERTLRKERDRGNISFCRLGGRVRYTAADLLAYIERGSRCATAAPPPEPDSSGPHDA